MESVLAKPLVSIGIPTYNRARLLKTSIESALTQDYENVEVIVSDNASIDETEEICRRYHLQDSRFKYVIQPKNLGPTANFQEVLKLANGQFFLWLGDDDSIDRAYVNCCMKRLIADSSLVLVGGESRYYREGIKMYDGRNVRLLHKKWWLRVISYYARVADNGIFYGVMRTDLIRQIEMPIAIGSDWLVVAGMVSIGRADVVPDVAIHRELGGATTSYRKIVQTCGLPDIQGSFPMASIAVSVWKDIVHTGAIYKCHSVFSRVLVGITAVLLVTSRPAWPYLLSPVKRCKRFFRRMALNENGS